MYEQTLQMVEEPKDEDDEEFEFIDDCKGWCDRCGRNCVLEEGHKLSCWCGRAECI